MAKKIDMCPAPGCPTPRLARIYHRVEGAGYRPYRDPFGREVFRCVTHGMALVNSGTIELIIEGGA